VFNSVQSSANVNNVVVGDVKSFSVNEFKSFSVNKVVGAQKNVLISGLGQESKLSSVLINKQGSRLRSSNELKLNQGLNLGSEMKLNTELGLGQESKLNQKLGQEQRLNQVQKQQQSQLQKQSSRLSVNIKSISVPVIGGLPKFDNNKSDGLFNVFVRKKGKFKKLRTFGSKEEAFGFGSKFVGGTASASFKITSDKGVNVDFKDFNVGNQLRRGKKESSVFIEKNKFRIDTPMELQQITGEGIRKNRKGGFK
jgi:hypothetical protein